MANNLNFNSISFLLISVFLIWLPPSVKSLNFSTPEDNCDYLYNYIQPQNCDYGSYKHIYNHCPSKVFEFCYVDLDQQCYEPERRCRGNLQCSCGKCMNCMNGRCNMELCQKGIQERYLNTYKRNLYGLFNRVNHMAETGYYY